VCVGKRYGQKWWHESTRHSRRNLYNRHADAEAALHELHDEGFPIETLSIIGREYHIEEYVVGYYNTGEGMQYWASSVPFDAVSGDCSWAREGAVVAGGGTAIGAGLLGIGISEGGVLQYETAIKADQFLLVAHWSAHYNRGCVTRSKVP